MCFKLNFHHCYFNTFSFIFHALLYLITMMKVLSLKPREKEYIHIVILVTAWLFRVSAHVHEPADGAVGGGARQGGVPDRRGGGGRRGHLVQGRQEDQP